MYKLLYLLKRVEYQINPKFESTQRVLLELRHNTVIETTFLTTSIVILIFILTITIVFLINPDSHSNGLDFTYFFVCFAFFFLNLYIIFQFWKMAQFFTEILSHSKEISVTKSKVFLYLNVSTIVITLFRYYVHGQLFTLIGIWDDSLSGFFYTSSANLVFMRITRYIS